MARVARNKAPAPAPESAFLAEERVGPTEGVGRGNEDVTAQDIVIPRIAIVQDLSPQRKKSNPEYIDGADSGMVFNTVTQQLYGDSVFIAPVYFRKEWVIWKDRKEGGGFRGAYPREDAAYDALERLEDGDACEVIDTAQHFVLVISIVEGGKYAVEEAVLSMAKSQHKPSRKLNSLCRMRGGDRWTTIYKMRVVEATNPQGQEYFNWDPAVAGNANQAVCDKAEAMYEAVKSGAKDVDRSDVRGRGNEEQGTEDEDEF